MADSSEYPIRYVAFLDIIGFRGLISLLDGDPSQVSFVRKLLHNVHRPKVEDFQDIFIDSDLRGQSISDAVAISANPTAAGLGHMLVAIQILAIELMEMGFFLRGAVVKGRLYHDAEMVFGDGLVQAYRFESTIARYPRIMIPKRVGLEIEEFLKQGTFKGIFSDAIRESDDGPLYLHVLGRFEEIKELKDDKRKRLLARLIKIRDRIEGRLREAVDEPAHFEKVRWFAAYWNDVFYGVEGLSKINGPGLSIGLAVE